jgi:biotin carboxylase
VPYPETLSFNSQNEPDLSSAQDLEYPLVIKLSEGIGAENLQIIRNEKELRQKKQKVPEDTSFLVQEFEKGKIIDHDILAEDGELVSLLEAERLHMPIEGGPSFYRKTTEVTPELEKYTEKLLEELKWTGVAQIEYIQREDESFLLEINGRFWGSLPLAEAAGANFPLDLLDLLLYGKEPDFSYRKNVYCRRLVYDLSWMLQNYRHPQEDPYLRTKEWRKVFSEFKNLLAGKESFDTFDLKDPLPFILNFREIWD